MERPTSVLVFGALNIVFGVIGIFGLFSSIAILVAADASNPVSVIIASSDVYRGWMWVASGLGIVATFALIAAGVGLLMSKPWARKLSIGYGIYAIVMGLFTMVMNAVYLMGPLMEQASRASGPEAAGALGGAIGGTFGGCLGIIYPVLLLIFMYRRNVIEHFERSHQAS